ncbi:formate dehydrogenase subunit alpha [Gordonibacter massiliensis (ex Traore et al. 2017)]|uniref:formate dehydrogenase subunit alpha n=1 Tax=Gordonibacter massiliensis (ex Traore et al. 2017) TaxID=1841863 RepID=UPI001C8CC7A5|nr:formate dehydrogenase subunit alpha [Gordonibacter massiliensis (ex Traore et al. 2017)]MBX9033386.1 formate dehydrogenase subunit alpha [Gordonibacter massiliensis (ex Traore et al. 2017)]
MEKHMAVCPYCGAGCKMNLVVENGLVIEAEGLDGVTNEGELCLKGLYGYDFINDTRILTPRIYHPMIRRQKGAPLERVSWDEALDFTASRLRAIIEESGPEAVMLTGSSRGAGNEANFVMQKFTRACLGTNNIDNCARTCHAASVIGLMECVGSGAMSVSIPVLERTDCILLIGYNPAASHPIVARRIVKAKERGADLIVCDPRVIESARIADLYLPLENGSNLALVNALAYTIIDEDLADWDFIDNCTEGFDAWWEVVQEYAPEDVADVTGLAPELIRHAARRYAKAPSAVVGWGMGVTQQAQGVQTVRAIAALALITGHIGRPNSGLAPVRGQNNVQGSCDMGMWPSLYPGYQRVDDPAVRAKFAAAWGVPEERLSLEEGWKLTDLPHGVAEGKIRAFYNFGEDPLQTEPDTAQMRKTLEGLDLLISQDIFMTQTTALADVVLPATSWGEHDAVYTASDRSFQLTTAALPPKGECRHDWEIFADLSTRMGYPVRYESTREIWDEVRSLCPQFAGATYEKMAGLGFAQWPIYAEAGDDPDNHGTPELYAGGAFTTPDVKGHLQAAHWRPPTEEPDERYPLVLCTVREVGHYSCRSMTGNCKALAALADEPGYVSMSPADAEARGIEEEELVQVTSRRGKIVARAAIDERINDGAVYMTYQWWVGKCNELTLHAVDGESGTPEDKYSACQVEAIADQRGAEERIAEAYAELKSRLAAEADCQNPPEPEALESTAGAADHPLATPSEVDAAGAVPAAIPSKGGAADSPSVILSEGGAAAVVEGSRAATANNSSDPANPASPPAAFAPHEAEVAGRALYADGEEETLV